jgi:ppGpp synthetase/RelA/SpoT-type nucleotidyltranferase
MTKKSKKFKAKVIKKVNKTKSSKKAKKVVLVKSPPCLIKKQEFLRKYNIAENDFNKTGLTWDTLECISSKHVLSYDDLHATGNYVVEQLRRVKAVHSIKTRVKEPEHLIEKIIRRSLEDPKATITCDNYEEHITDLVGIRALHLFKDEWLPIHQFVRETWELKEEPIANVREGDPETITKQFEQHGCKINIHPFGYRSIHYLLNLQPSKKTVVAELQVRTLFEEGWSEIDHKVRYPYEKEDTVLTESLLLFNRQAGSADEMGSFIKALQYDRAQTLKQMQKARQDLDAKNAELRGVIGKLKISDREKAELRTKVQELSRSSLGPVPNLTMDPDIDDLYGRTWKRLCSLCGREFRDFLYSTEKLCPDCRK